jgi:hemolysin activation/secretion protein
VIVRRLGRRDIGASLLGVLLSVGSSATALAQLAPPIGDPTGRSGDRPPLQRQERRPEPPTQVLPPLPPLPSDRETPSQTTVFVKEIRVSGNTVFPPEDIATLTAPYTNRTLTPEDLESLRLALTLLYVNRGYVNSGAILPDQTVTDGVVTYQIVEGRVTDIEVTGNEWFRSGYIRRRLSLGSGPPLNVNELQERLQLLLEDPRFRRLNAALKPGLRPGDSVLNVTVEDVHPFKLAYDFNNHQPPSVGAERSILTLEHQNVTGNGDIATVRYGRSEGLDPLLDVRYALPVTARDTIVALQYRRNTFAVVEEPFEALDIESKTDIYTVAVRHPVYRTINTEVALELTGERLSSRTFLLGERFTLSPGAHNGESVVVALRAAQEWVHRTENAVLAARSRFTAGLDALDSTVHNDNRPDSEFFAWLGQFQWVQRLGLLDSTAIFRSDLQLANDSLLTLEQVAVGGRYSVRGYRENTLLRDNAFLASVELRIPLVRNVRWADFVELAPFVDYGRGWNTKPPTGEPLDLASIGIGLRWALTIASPGPFRPSLEVYWGHPLRDIPTSGKDLQDKGLHVQFVFAVF